MLGPVLIVLLAWLALAGAARAADGPALLEATAPPIATAPAQDAAGTQAPAVEARPPAVPPVTAIGPDDAAPIQAAVAPASPPPPAASIPPPPAPAQAVAPPPPAAPVAGAEFERAIGGLVGDLVGDTLLGRLPEAMLPDLRDELGPTAGLIGQVGDSVREILDPFAEAPTPMPPVPAPPGAGAGTPPPVLGPAPPIVASVRSAGLPPVQPVATTRGPSVLAGDSGSAPAALAVADLAGVADPLGAVAGKGTAIGPPGSAARTRALAPDGSEAGVAPLAAAPAAAGAAASPASALPGPPGPRAPVPPAPVSERTAPAGAAPAGPAPFLPPAPAPAPADHTGLSGLGGSSTSTLLLGVAALCGLIALARPPNGLRRMSLQPAPYVPAMFAVSLERPG